MQSADLQQTIIEQWIQKLLDDKIVKPSTVSDFQTNLLQGMLEENEEKLQAAYAELTKAGGKVLKSEIEKFKTTSTASAAPEKAPFEEQIDKFLQAQDEGTNDALREQMISKLKSGDKKQLIEYVEDELPVKRISKFIEFIEKFNPSTNDLILKSSQSQGAKKTLDETGKASISNPPEELLKAHPALEKEVEEAKFSDPIIEETKEKDFLQKIESIPEKKRKIWILFQTFEDTSAEYKMKKIKLQEKECENFIASLKCKKIKVQSYFGGSKRCFRLAEEYLGEKILEDISSVKDEAIIALSNGEKACLLFLTADDFFDFERKADPNELTVNYLRILVDLSQVICIVPDENFRLNPDSQNPYVDRPNRGYNIEEQKLDPSDEISIRQVPVAPARKDEIQGFGFSKFVFSCDYTKNLVKVETKVEVDSESKSHQSIENKISLGHVQACDLKDLSYPQLKNALVKNWSSFQSFVNSEKDQSKAMKDFLKSMLLKFISKDKKTQYKNELELLVDKHLEIKKDIWTESRKTLDILVEKAYESFYQFVAKNRCDPAEKSFFTKAKNFIVGDGNLEPADNVSHAKCSEKKIEEFKKNLKLNRIDFPTFEKKIGTKFRLHSTTERSVESFLHQINNELGELEKTENAEYVQNLIAWRNGFFQEVFLMTDKFVKEKKPENLLLTQFNFYNMNILRGIKDAEYFNITLQPVKLINKFNQDLSPKPSVRAVYFLQENSGLILISDFPPQKSSLYGFDLSNKSDPRAESMLTLGSPESHLLVEPNLKLWCIYDNKEQRFNMGKLSAVGKLEGWGHVDVFNEKREECVIEKIISACYLPLSDSFFIINQDSDLFELKYHSKALSLVMKKENTGDSCVQKSKIVPADPTDKYLEIQTTLDGRNIILLSKKSLDIYDLSWNRAHSIKVDSEENGDFVKFKTFVDGPNHFLIIFKANETVCYQLAGSSITKTLKDEFTGIKEQVSNGNPIFDYLYLAFRQFGPQSCFIGSPSETKVAFLNLDEQNEDNINKYFKSLNMPETSLKIYQNEKAFLASKLTQKIKEMDSSRFKMILLTRVPLHVATIENFTLKPLKNGENISDQIATNCYGEKNHDLIDKLMELIGFGVYEEFLASCKRKISVVSIVGKQSSGKSYVMNREFGTRFGVASERCTDGIWISMAEMKDGEDWKLFVVLDCEGLFSARRNDQEEIKLCLTLAAISDVMILNQDLSFNRHFNRLFNNFSNSIGKLKGRKLFKGYLMMLIRDVKSEAADGAYKELKSNIAQVTRQENNFLAALFQGKLKSQCLNYFEKEVFHAEIEDIRNKYFTSLDGERWETGSDFLESLKITLAQVFMEDDTDMDQHKLRILCERTLKEAINMFYGGGNEFGGEGSVYIRDFDFDGQSLNVEIHQKDIILGQSIAKFLEEIPSEKNEEKEEEKDNTYIVEEVIKEFSNQTTKYSQKIHNTWVTNLNACIEELLEERIKFLLGYFDSKMPKETNYKEIINSTRFELETKLNTVLEQSKNCQKQCRKCDRVCQLPRNHAKNCDCDTTHICEMQCILTPECTDNGYLCVNVSGHDGNHRCNQGAHKCSSVCSMCPHTCAHEIGHPDTTLHDCQNKHPCNEKCIDEKCTRTCQFDLRNDHKEHICVDNRCVHKCSLCEKQCVFKHHLHDKFIKENKSDLLQHEADGKTFELGHHSCGNEHACVEKCSEKGVCQIGYNVIEKEWKNSFGSFTYPFFEPKESRQQCKVLIPKFALGHQEAHNCKIGVHRCSQKCEECKSFCNKDIDHEGLHSTPNHRNKENNVFVSSKGKSTIEIVSDGKTRKYAVGEFCQPENCTTSCTRKGRAHYHLKECPGGNDCAANIHPYVKHSNETFEPCVDKVFDLWLCENYWNSMSWDAPVQKAVQDELKCCNFVCNHYSHEEDDLKFCNKKAWHHETDHKFDCKHDDNYASLIDIVFCCDTTGSMSRYIESSKETVKKVVATAAEASKTKERDVKFAFVAYRDHPPEAKEYITKVQDFCSDSQILTFIQSLTADEGGDGPEAVLDGLRDSILKVNWRRTSTRYIFHIADAPPHGKEYTGGCGDSFPNGCPCGVKIEDLATFIEQNKIKYKLLKIGSYANTMAQVFRSKIKGYEESDLDSAIELPKVVNKIIARDISTDEQDVLVKRR